MNGRELLGLYNLEVPLENLDQLTPNERELVIILEKKYTENDKQKNIKEIVEILKKWNSKNDKLDLTKESETTKQNNIINRMKTALNNNKAPEIIYEVLKYIDYLIDKENIIEEGVINNILCKKNIKVVIGFIRTYKFGTKKVANIINKIRKEDVQNRIFVLLENETFASEILEIINKLDENIISDSVSLLFEMILKTTESDKLSNEEKKRILRIIANNLNKTFGSKITKMRSLDYFVIEILGKICKDQINKQKWLDFMEKILSSGLDLDTIANIFTRYRCNEAPQSYLLDSFNYVNEPYQIQVLRELQIEYVERVNQKLEELKQQCRHEQREMKEEEKINESDITYYVNKLAVIIGKTRNEIQAKMIQKILKKHPQLSLYILGEISNIIYTLETDDIDISNVITNIISSLIEEIIENPDIDFFNKIKEFIQKCCNLSKDDKLHKIKLISIKEIYENSNLSLDDLIILANEFNKITSENTLKQIILLASNYTIFTENGLKEAIKYVLENNSPIPYELFKSLLKNEQQIIVITQQKNNLTCVANETVKVFDLPKKVTLEDASQLLKPEENYTKESEIVLRYSIKEEKTKKYIKMRDRRKAFGLQ